MHEQHRPGRDVRRLRDRRRAAGNPAAVPDEDDFVGTVTFGPKLATNALPSAAIAGPDAVKQGGIGDVRRPPAPTPGGGMVKNYAFDLDGDGRFEVDNGAVASVTKRFDTAGMFNVGVRVTDDQGGRSYASRVLTVQAPPIKQPSRASRSNRPVFGGKRKRPLKVSFRLREQATVTLDLYRGKKRVKRYIAARARSAGTTYTQRISAKGRRRGDYTVRISDPHGQRAHAVGPDQRCGASSAAASARGH